MIKPLVLVVAFCLFSTFCFSQKIYEFDFLVEYELTLYKDSIKIKNRPFREKDTTLRKIYLTNSKKNNYTAVITPLDSLRYKLVFKDENGIHSNAAISKSDLNRAEFITVDCKHVFKFENPFKYQTKNYAFSILNDTSINGKTYSRYKLESIKPKKVKRLKLGVEFYIIDKETTFHTPILNSSTAYQEWKLERNLPNGIFAEKYFIDYHDQLDSKESLVGYRPIDKKIMIPNDCDYTEQK